MRAGSGAMQTADRFSLGPFQVRPDRNQIAGPEGIHHVEPKAMAVLLELAAAGDRTVPRETLVRAVWPRGFVSDDALTGCIMQLRHAFGDDAHAQHCIATVPKLGYRLMLPCTSPEASPSRDLVVGVETRRSAGRLAERHPRILQAALSTAVLLVVSGTWLGPRKDPSHASAGMVAPVLRESVAVLPFTNLSNDRDNAFFARGMQDEMLSDLAGIADLKVVSRTSVMKYASDSAGSMPEIARALGVTYVIEGSVQRIGHRIRVTAQLIDAGHDAHLWAGRYDREANDVFAVQSEIARDVAGHLRARLAPRRKPATRMAPVTVP